MGVDGTHHGKNARESSENRCAVASEFGCPISRIG